jgi:hypothetical protein
MADKNKPHKGDPAKQEPVTTGNIGGVSDKGPKDDGAAPKGDGEHGK